jgi:hypothetical protein
VTVGLNGGRAMGPPVGVGRKERSERTHDNSSSVLSSPEDRTEEARAIGPRKQEGDLGRLRTTKSSSSSSENKLLSLDGSGVETELCSQTISSSESLSEDAPPAPPDEQERDDNKS